MTKADIVENLCETHGFSKKESAQIVEQLFDILKKTLEEGENIKISGFGNFTVKAKADRRGRNPQTGDKIMIKSIKVLSFKPSKILMETLNKNQ